MSVNLELKDIQTLIAEVQKEYESMQKSEEKEMKEKGKEEEKLEKEAVELDGPKAEDSMPDVEEKQEEHLKEEVEEEMSHQSVEELLSEYMKLDEDDLMAHLIACNQAVSAKMKEEEEETEEMVEGIMSKAKKMPMSKKVFVKKQMKKSEAASKEVKKEVAELKNQLNVLVKNVESLASKPKSLAFNGNNFLTKSEPAVKQLTKSEIVNKLSEKARQANLTLEDSQKIVKFSLNPVVTEELKKFLNI